MLTITFSLLSEKFVLMTKTQVTSYEKLMQLHSSQTTPTLYHLMLSRYTQAF